MGQLCLLMPTNVTNYRNAGALLTSCLMFWVQCLHVPPHDMSNICQHSNEGWKDILDVSLHCLGIIHVAVFGALLQHTTNIVCIAIEHV